ncbi:hypothetical protein Tco_0954324 [Tanacetum coccineum]|uniref:Integrase, catalytic region, zinc finger, CCHC-type, peptidase aspartic, catalytic n=1 Tax=Tanacetum coccineum TaxID=301880 RepID=A0ABQ5E4G4_9ASTR
MTTLVEHMIVAGADNRPPMLEKSMYDSWQSRMLFYIQGKEHGRMIHDLVMNGPLVWSTIEVDGVTRPKTYKELSEKEKLQADCDLKATNIVLQGLPPDVYSLVNHHKLAKDLHTTNYDQLYAYPSQHEAHANEVHVMRERYLYPIALVANYHHTPPYLNNHHSQYNPTQYQQQLSPVGQQMYSPSPQNQATIQDGRVIVQQVQGRQGGRAYGKAVHSAQKAEEFSMVQGKDVASSENQVTQTTILQNAAFPTDDLDAYDSDYDDISSEKKGSCHTPKWGLDGIRVRGRDVIIYITKSTKNNL